MRNVLFASVLSAVAVHVQAGAPPVSFHVANNSEQALEVWINGEAFEISSVGGIMFPCIEHEVHTVQTEHESVQVSCGSIVEFGQ